MNLRDHTCAEPAFPAVGSQSPRKLLAIHGPIISPAVSRYDSRHVLFGPNQNALSQVRAPLGRRQSIKEAIVKLIISAAAAIVIGAMHPACAANPPGVLEELAAAVGNRGKSISALESRIGPLLDCSQIPIAELDKRAGYSDFHFIYKWGFSWATEHLDGGTCIYLQKPERRGLTRSEAQVFLSAQDLPFPTDWAEPKCRAPASTYNSLDDDTAARTTQDSKGDGYTSSVTFVTLDEELRPLDEAQHEFANKRASELAHRLYASEEKDSASEVSYQLVFQLVRVGEFASVAGTGSTVSIGRGTPPGQSYGAWLLLVPERKLLPFDELFVDPALAREHIVKRAAKYLGQRYRQIYVHDRTETERNAKEADIDAAITRALSTSSATWSVALDVIDPCEPALLVTFEPHELLPDVRECAEVPLALRGLTDLLKANLREALSPSIPAK
jgi:hypothetical protein